MNSDAQEPLPLPAIRAEVARGGSLPAAVRAHTGVVGVRGLLELDSRLRAHLQGAGEVLQPWLAEPEVTDVLVNGSAVWVDRGRGLERVSADLGDPAQVRALAVRLAAACGQRLDDASPIVDGSLPDGTRLHAVLPPVSGDGTLISLRTQRPHAFSLDELVRAGTVPPPIADVILAMVAARANVLVSGATGTGKTTLLAAVLGLVGPDERIVVIEEVAELRPDHPHVVHLQVRHANVQHAGEVPMSDLVRAAMRMRPDRLVLGECRGAEVREVLGGLNTGHDGGWATIHANTSGDVPSRLVALGALAGLDAATVAAQAVSALDAVVHLRRRAGRREVCEVAVLERTDGELAARLAVEAGADGGVRAGPGWPYLAARIGLAAPPGRHSLAGP